MIEDTFERISQFFQLAVVIVQQLPRDVLDSREKVQNLIDNPGEWGLRLRCAFDEEHKQAGAPTPKEDVEELGWIDLDPAIPFAERVRRGNYSGGVAFGITENNSQLARNVRRRIVLYDTKGRLSTEEIKHRMKENGDRPCDLDDGLGIGEKYPKRQVANPLPLLDDSAVCNDYAFNPVLEKSNSGRRLELRNNGMEAGAVWLAINRFPAIREEQYLDV